MVRRAKLSLNRERICHKVWYKLHVCPDASRWTNVLVLCELAFSLQSARKQYAQRKTAQTGASTSRDPDAESESEVSYSLSEWDAGFCDTAL